jgi:predicted HicB family RNase H-like nuclease
MSKTSTYPLRLPKSLKDEVAGVAKRDGTSINQFIAIAAAEKVSALFRQGGEAPRIGDELE